LILEGELLGGLVAISPATVAIPAIDAILGTMSSADAEASVAEGVDSSKITGCIWLL